MQKRWQIVAVIGLAAAPVLALDVPLTVRETARVGRIGNPVNSGVPLPRGAVRETAQLRLLDAQGKAMPASIETRARWLGDGSHKWVTVHFLANVPANDKISRKIPADRLAPFVQVYLRADVARPFAPADALLEQPAAGQTAEIEERGPGRAVVALKGTFSTPTASKANSTAGYVWLPRPARSRPERAGPGRSIPLASRSGPTARSRSTSNPPKASWSISTPITRPSSRSSTPVRSPATSRRLCCRPARRRSSEIHGPCVFTKALHD